MLESPLIAWLYYLSASLGLLAVGWRLTLGLSSTLLRRLLRALLAALLLCPFSIGDGYTQMAPAVLMVSMETLFEGPEAFMRVGPTLLAALALAALLALLWDLYSRRRAQQLDAQDQLDLDREALLQESQARQSP